MEKDEGIYVLTEKNYDQAIKQFKHLLVEFYAPWCGHCKALGPEYVKAAQLLKEKDSEIKLAKVDGTEEEELIKKMNVQGYPTLLFYRGDDGTDEPVKYTGGRMANEIVGWLEKKTGPSAVQLESSEDVKEFIANDDVVVIGFFKDQEGEKAKQFLAAVRDFEEYPIGISSNEEAMTANKVDEGTVVLFKKFDEGRAVYEGAIGKGDALIEFIQRYALPIVIDFNHETAQKIFRGLVKSHLLVFVNKSSEDYEEKYAKPVQVVAEEYRHKIMFVIVDLNEEDNRRVVEFLGLKGESMPNARIVQMEQTDVVKYKPETTEVTEENLKRFVDDFLAGKVPVHYLSEKLPEDWDKEPVKVLTGENFDAVALDKTKSVLVEFYAPWCGHCKQLLPVWEKLAESLKDKEDILVAKIDATVNEIPHTRVRSFPTIKLYLKDTNEVHEYNGESKFVAIIMIALAHVVNNFLFRDNGRYQEILGNTGRVRKGRSRSRRIVVSLHIKTVLFFALLTLVIIYVFLFRYQLTFVSKKLKKYTVESSYAARVLANFGSHRPHCK